ncbi:MAG: ABC transporter substrate-binding protein [Sphingobium sp.]
MAKNMQSDMQGTRDGFLQRRSFLIGVGGLAGTALLPGCGAPVSREQKLRVSRNKGGYELILRIAGLKPEGFELSYNFFQSGHLVIEALNAGSLDFGTMSEIPPVFAAASSMQSFRQIATIAGDVNNQVILVPKHSNIRDLIDLKGKRVAYVRATTSQYFLIRMLQSVGLGWKDIEPVSMSTTDGAAAFSTGAVDAWAIYGFQIQRAIAKEGARVLKTALGFLSGNYIASAHVDALANPAKVEQIGAYLRLFKQGMAWKAGHETAYAEALAKEVEVPLQYTLDQIRNASQPTRLLPVTDAVIASQQEVADVFFKAGLLPRAVDVRPLWDDRFNAILSD